MQLLGYVMKLKHVHKFKKKVPRQMELFHYYLRNKVIRYRAFITCKNHLLTIRLIFSKSDNCIKSQLTNVQIQMPFKLCELVRCLTVYLHHKKHTHTQTYEIRIVVYKRYTQGRQ